MNMKEAMAGMMEVVPTKTEIGQELTKEVGNIKDFIGNVMSEIGAEMAEQVKHGSHEMAAALLGKSDGFVMYPHEGKQPEKEQEMER